MKRAMLLFLTVVILLTSCPYVTRAEDEMEGVAVTDGLSVSRSFEVSADEGGASLEVSVNGATQSEQTVTFSSDGIVLDGFDGIRFWAKNSNDKVIRFSCSFDQSSDNKFSTEATYYTVGENRRPSEKLFTAEDTGAGEKIVAAIPSTFEGWIYIPFSSFVFLSPPTVFSELHININTADVGSNKFYIDEIGGYTGNLPLYDFEDTLGISDGSGFDRTISEGKFGQGKFLELVCNSASVDAVSLMNLDLRSAKTANRDVSKIEGIRFWIKTLGGGDAQTADHNIYLYTAYNFPNHSHYPDWCNFSMPYYLISSDGAMVAKQRSLNKTYELYQKGIVIPDGFEGWVYMPFNTEALWNGALSKWVSQTNGLLSTLKITAGNAVGKTVYFDSLGFYTNGPEAGEELSAMTFFSFCTSAMDAAKASKVTELINSVLPYSLDMREKLEKVRAEYDGLTLKQRELVENYSVLADAEILLDKVDKSQVKLDFESEADLGKISYPENVSVSLDSSNFCTGESSLSVAVDDEIGNVNTVKLTINDSLDSLFSFEFWIKTGDSKAELTFQVDAPSRCTIQTDKRYYLSDAEGTQSFSVQEKKVGNYYQPYMTVPANFEGYVNIPFTSLKSYSSAAIDISKVGFLYLGIIGGNHINIDTVCGSFMLAQNALNDDEICVVWESVSSLRNNIALLTDISTEDAERVQVIRRQFNDMSINLQLLIDNVEILENAELKLRELKPSKYLLDYEDKTLFDWSGLSNNSFTTAFEYDTSLEGNVSMKITTTDSGEFMSVAFKKSVTDLSEYNGVEMRVKTSDKPAVFFIQADIPVRALLQAGAPYHLTDMNGNITSYTASGTNLGGNYGWCPLITIPANFDGFFSFKCESFKCYDSAAQVDLTKMGNFYLVFTQSSELIVDAVRLYKRMLEGLNILGDDRTNQQKAEDFDKAVVALGEISLSKQKEIAALRKQYTILSDECKALVSNLNQLETAEEKIKKLLNSDILFDFDSKEILWSCSEGANAAIGEENALSGNSLKLTYPNASYFNFSNVRRGFSNKTGLEFYADSEASSLISIQIDAPYRCYVPKGQMYFLIDSDGNITERETYLNGYISIPAGFVGRVQVPFESFAAYDANTDFLCEQMGDLYFSFADGYGKYGELYIDSVKVY